MKKYVLQECSGSWKLMTKEHYLAHISNADNVWTFTRSDGFNNLEDVLSYIEKWFHISPTDIEIINNNNNLKNE